MKKKLAILGKLDTKFNAPFDDPNYDIWAFNLHSDENQIKRVDVWFDIHTHEWVNPKAIIKRDNFPFDECHKLVGGHYFNNTVSYLIALAILKGYKEIELYGMRFNSGEEVRKQEYNNVRELIFFAKGRGIKITAPYDPIMLKEYPLYGI